MLAPTLFGIQFAILALICMILPIDIATKNAILMIDSALQAQREDGTEPREAIFHAVVTTFRSMMMTTTAASLGALTLYATPIVYLYLDRPRLRVSRAAHG